VSTTFFYYIPAKRVASMLSIPLYTLLRKTSPHYCFQNHSQSIGSFIAARAACGLGARGVIAMSGIITSDIVKLEYRGIYQSYLNMAWGGGNGLGGAFGGFLCEFLG